MPIYSNEGGMLYEHDAELTNEGGVLYEQDTVHSNEGGVLYEIFSALPSEITWNVKKPSGSAFPTAKINSVEANGFTLNVYLRYEKLDVINMSYIYSDPISLKAETKISYTTSNLSGTGQNKKELGLYLMSEAPTNCIPSTAVSAGGYIVPKDGDYYFGIAGYSATYTGSQSGPVTNYYPVTGDISITLSR